MRECYPRNQLSKYPAQKKMRFRCTREHEVIMDRDIAFSLVEKRREMGRGNPAISD